MAKKGISNETRGTSLKKFKPSPSVHNGLCIGALVDVNVSEAEIKDDSPMESFRGKTIPRLNFVFESRLDPPGVKTSTYIHSYLAQEHNEESVTEKGAWRWEQLAQGVKHLLDVYRDNKPLTPEEVELMQLDFEDVDEETGLYKPQPAEVVLGAFTKFFNNIVTIFKPEGKAIYKTVDGKDIIVWMKLILDYKGAMVNKGDFGFSNYPGEGYIEIYKQGVAPSLSINIAKGENIIPKAPVAAAPRPSAAGTGSSSVPEDMVPDFMKG